MIAAQGRQSILCRLGFHAWDIYFVDMAGHQSRRSRRCCRCLDRGRLLTQTQRMGYWGGASRAPWITDRDEVVA